MKFNKDKPTIKSLLTSLMKSEMEIKESIEHTQTLIDNRKRIVDEYCDLPTKETSVAYWDGVNSQVHDRGRH